MLGDYLRCHRGLYVQPLLPHSTAGIPGFFAGKRFVPIISGLAAIVLGVVLSFIWPPIGTAIQTFSQWAAYQNPVVAFGIYGVVERALVPFGLHHIWNVPFQMQIGEFTNAAGRVFHGDIPRYMAGDPTAGKLSGGFLFKMYGLPAAAIAIWHSAKPENRAKVGGIMISAALTSFLTGITEPIEFSFMFVAPILYVIHAIRPARRSQSASCWACVTAPASRTA